MKKFFWILFSIILFAILPTQAQWTEQTSPTTNALYSVSVVDNNVAWIGGASGTVLRTTDGGATWTNVGGGAIGTGPVYNIFGIDAQNALCTASPAATYIYRTTDGGSTWTQVYTNASGFGDAIWMFDANNGIFYGDPVGGNWELYSTSDGGATWNALPALAQNGTEAGWNNAMFVSGSNVYFGTNNTTLYYSSDGGNSWTPQTTTGQLNTYSVWFNNSTTGLAGGTDLDMTTDGGTTWSPISVPGTGTALGGVMGVNNQWWVARQSAPGIIYYSTDNGTTWSTQYTSPTTGAYYHIAKARNGTLALAVRSDGGISSYNIILPVELTSFTASASTDGNVQLNWATATESNNQKFEIQRKADNDNFVTIGTIEGQGTTTQEHKYSFVDSKVNPGTYTYRLKQVDFSGTFKYSNSVQVVVSPPLTFGLEQNYPNPFNPTTNIKYNIAKPGFVKLTVYNIIGQEVAVLVNGYKEAGFYTANFNASNLPSGTYIYRLQSNNSISVKKMILMK